LGGQIFGDDSTKHFSFETFLKGMENDKFNTVVLFQRSLVFGMLAWLVLSPLIMLAIYVVSYPILKKVLPNQKPH